MKNKMKFLTYGIFVLLIAFTSCSGEDGEMGPPGANGTNGVDGQDGNANVIASDWLSTNFSTTPVRSSGFNITDSNITQENLDNAAILVYGKSILEENVVFPIPFLFGTNNYYYALYPESNIIRFIGQNINSRLTYFDLFTHVRYVIIPPTATKGAKNVDFTKMSYEEVMDYFNLDY